MDGCSPFKNSNNLIEMSPTIRLNSYTECRLTKVSIGTLNKGEQDDP